MLTRKSMTTINLEDQEVSRFQDNVEAAVNQLLAEPISDGVLVTTVVIPASGLLTVPHGMGRRAQGWFIVYASAAYTPPYAPAAAQTSPNNAVMLQFPTGAGATVSVWVF